jgi:hypothetical protein
MKFYVLILAIFIYISVSAQGFMQPKKETVEALQKTAFLTGSWKGSGWKQMGPQKHSFNQTETVAYKANNTVIQIEGSGTDEKNSNVIIHQAFAIISFDIQNLKYRMIAFRGDGEQVNAEVSLPDDHTFQWSFSNPMAGQIRYIISVKDNKWFETGEMNRDGKTWNKFFEMTLEKQ